MKKSELNKYIRENIISTLSEDTEAEIAKTKELTSAIKDLESAKKEAGIEEDATPLRKDFTYDYEDIGQFYLEGFGKEHTLNQDQLEKLGKTITKRFYGGDIKKAYDDVYKTSQNAAAKRLADRGQLKNPRYVDGTSIKENANMGLADIEEMGYRAADDVFTIISKSYINSQIDFRYFQKGLMRGLSDIAGSMGLNENEDAEPTKSDIKKTKGLAKAKEELALLTREMKSLAKKYSKAEGEEKEKLVKILKDKTKLKKELENILDKKKI